MGSAASDPDSVLDAFFAHYESDLAEGRVRDLAGYQALFPGSAAAIADVWQELHRAAAPDPGLRRLTSRALGDDPLAVEPAPERIGGYRILRLLGAGGMGEVWLAEEDHPRRLVALKVLPPDQVTPEALRRFEHEAELLGRLQHPGIARVYAAGRDPGRGTAWIAMQYVEGEPLSRRISRSTATRPDAGYGGGPATALHTHPDPAAAIRLAEKAARALHAAHEAGVIHRDVKPGNIIVAADGDPVLVDFGIARDTAGGLATLTRTGQAPGTPAYMSPEQISGSGALDRRTDVWSLAVTLHECLTGRRPFEAATYERLRDDILRREVVFRRSLSRLSGAPRDLETVLETALRKEPARRYPTAAAFADDLLAVLERRPVAARPVSAAGRFARWARREPAKAALALVLAFAVPAVASLLTWFAATRDEVLAARAQERAREIDELLGEAWFELDEGLEDRAEAGFRRILDLDPAQPEALAGLAFAFNRRKDGDAALAVVGRAQSLGVRDPAFERLRAHALRGLGRTAEADALDATLRRPDSTLGWFLLGSELIAAGHGGAESAWPKAVDALERANLMAPAPRPILDFQLAHAAAHARNRAVAARMADALRSRWPASPRARYWSGFALVVSGADKAGGLALYREALRDRPGDPRLLIEIGLALLDLDRPDEALPVLKEAVAAEPGHPRARFALGIAYSRAGRVDEALAENRAALALDPRAAKAWNNVGYLLATKGEFAEAVVHYEKALELTPGDPQPAINLGVALLKTGGDPARAEKLFRGALEAVPRDGSLWHYLAASLDRLGRDGEVVDAALKTVALGSDDPLALKGAGLLLRKHRRFREAAEAFRAAAKLAPEDPGYAVNAAAMLADAGDVAGAEAAYREILRDQPDAAEAACNLGLLLQKTGRIEEALPHLVRGNELGRARPGWTFPSAGWVKKAEAEFAAARSLDAIAAGGPLPADPAACLELAAPAARWGRTGLAARLYAEAFAGDPALAADPTKALRLEAAEAAARAASGDDRDAGAGDASARAAWRARALAILRADLDALARRAAAGRIAEDRLEALLGRWTSSVSLAPLRDDPALRLLPARERAAWRDLWDAVADLRSKIE